jgi:cytoskeletal protein CcmA (bactofilin family)
MSFFNKSEDEDKTKSNASLPSTCNIAKDTLIKGNINTSDDLRIDGKIIGDVNCEKKLVMDSSGSIDGNVTAADADIKGRIEGKVVINGTLHLLETAFVKGIIQAKQLIVEDGAKYEGETKIG